MPLWGIKYMDLDEQWWLDLRLQETPPPVSSVAVGARVFVDGFGPDGGRVVARRTSIRSTDLPDWPADAPVALRPAPEGQAS